ncbi:MAG: hypothetical protein R3F43_05340 [bacterium]
MDRAAALEIAEACLAAADPEGPSRPCARMWRGCATTSAWRCSGRACWPMWRTRRP